MANQSHYAKLPTAAVSRRGPQQCLSSYGNFSNFLDVFRLPMFSNPRIRKYCVKLVLICVLCTVLITSFCSEILNLRNPGIYLNRLVATSNKRNTRTYQLTTQFKLDLLKGDLTMLENSGNAHNESNKEERRLPSCIIFGVSKCGTRAVLEYLKLHPDIVAPNVEINYFNNKSLQARGLSWYLQQMPYSRPGQITAEKSPDYFQHHECAKMIYGCNRDTKLLLLLRDPVVRLVSQYMQLVDKRPTLPAFEDWVINNRTREINMDIPSVAVSVYSRHLSHWLKVFPRRQFHIIESESLKKSPLQEMTQVERFLHLRPFYSSEDFYFNSSRGFYCVRMRATGKTKCMGKSKGREHIAVKKEVVEQLYRFYQPYNKELNDLLNMKFSWS
ncbi:unnamed protein product [Lymnaea stagnalis]|uniref:Sulfotransferase domain-containing protein n=1 Tax=Lymnaea stagnalis TaxID=6523 RepID=A0AAV2IGX2_LYMST